MVENLEKLHAQNDLTDDVASVLTGALIALRRSAAEKEKKRANLQARMEASRGAIATPEDAIQSLANMGTLGAQKNKEILLGMDPHTFMDFNLGILKAMNITLMVMLKLLAVVLAFTTFVYGAISLTENQMIGLNEPLERERSAVEVNFW